METDIHIKKKKKLKEVIANYAKLKGYRLIANQNNNHWQLFRRDMLIISIKAEIMESIDLLELRLPICEQVNLTEEIFLKPIVAEHDFRELLGVDTIRRNGDKIEIYSPLKINSRDQYGSNKLLLNISDMIVKADRMSQELQSKMDIVMHIKLN